MEFFVLALMLLLLPFVTTIVVLATNLHLEKPGRLYVETLLMAIPGFIAALSGMIFFRSAAPIMSLGLAITIALGIRTIVQAYTVGKRYNKVKDVWISPAYVIVWIAIMLIVVGPEIADARTYTNNIDDYAGIFLILVYLGVGLWNTFRIMKQNTKVSFMPENERAALIAANMKPMGVYPQSYIELENQATNEIPDYVEPEEPPSHPEK